METRGQGLYLVPYKRGQGVTAKKEKKNTKKTIKVPTSVTTNVQLDQLARRMRVPYFISVFMCNALPISGVRRKENGIVNLDDAMGTRYSLRSVRKEKRSRCALRQFR
ncbi:hypothetical protein P5V15_014364 [Pogonomyrmex californicus]